MIKAPTLNPKDVQRALRALKGIDAEHVKALRSDLKTTLQGVANRTARALPQSPTLSNFASSPGWATPRGTVSFTPGRSRKSGNKLLTIKVTSSRDGSILISEFAGNRSSGRTASGRAMIESLNNVKPIQVGREGRFAYPFFRSQRNSVLKDAEKVMKKYMKIVEKKL